MELQIIKNGVEIDMARLYTVKDFADLSGFNYSTVRYRIGIGLLDHIIVAGNIFVIEPEDPSYKKKRKAGRKVGYRKPKPANDDNLS